MLARLGGAPLLLALVLGCGSEPDERIFGTFVLVGVEGHALPYLQTSDANCDVFISEGELILHEDGTYDLQFSGPLDCSRSGGPSDQDIGRVYAGTATQSGGALHFEMPVQGSVNVDFSGTVNPLEAIVTVPPIPPATGVDLRLQFAKT